VVGFAAGLPWGIEGVAVGFLVVSIATAPVYLRLTTDAVGLPPSEWLRSVAGVVQSGIAMMLLVLGARELLVGAGIADGALLAILVVLGAALYVGLVRWRDPEVAAEIGRLRERRRRGTMPAAAGEAELPDPAELPPARDL
jgi:choline-glycine betaine transporter